MPKTCPQLRDQLQIIKSKFKDYSLELAKAKTSKEYETIFNIQKELTIKIKELQELIPMSLEKAREIMGPNFLGPDAVEKALGVRLEQGDIPAIPFSKEDLDRAKELGQMLILRVDKAPDGEALSMTKLNSLLKDRFAKENKGRVLYDEAGWKKNEDFYTTETPQTAWALVSKEIIPNSLAKNYLEQTELLVAYIQNSVFKDVAMPQEYADAIAEFEAQKAEIGSLMLTDWKEAGDRLFQLKLNQLTRQTPVEALYDIDVRLLNNGDRLLERSYTWTNRRYSDGRFVLVGSADAGGVHVGAYEPDHPHASLGVSFSRSR